MFEIKAEYVFLLKEFVSTDRNLDAIACINIEPAECGGAYITALDGHCFGMFYDQESTIPHRVLLRPSKALFQACKPARGKRDMKIVGDDWSGRLKVLGRYGEEVYVEPGNPFRVGLAYPNWKVFMTNTPQAEPFETVMPLDVFARFNFPDNNAHRGLHLYTTGKEGMVFVLNKAYPSFLGIFMPMVDYEENFPDMPAWLPTPQESARANG